ncbi:unnamed protein product [Linum tenue]|uniref:Uncharacterized protein n=1 Tax=Linum tenue TaxID=586396 RepID=A0AAV0H7L7_9ROSI|nr:unnamed protein product [Linum tenue]
MVRGSKRRQLPGAADGSGLRMLGRGRLHAHPVRRSLFPPQHNPSSRFLRIQ